MEDGTAINDAIMNIPSPFPIDPDNLGLGIKKANVIDLCNKYYAAQALGVNPITGTKGEPDAKYVVNGYSHATALPCEISTWNDDENIYIDMLDPNAIFSIFFTDVLVSDEMQDSDFAAAITGLPVAVKSELKTVVYNALDAAGYKYNTLDKMRGPKYKTVEDIFEVVAASPQGSPYTHIAYTKMDGEDFEPGETSTVAQGIIDAMSIHGETDAGKQPWDVSNTLSQKSSWRSDRHESLGLSGFSKVDKNWVIEGCSPHYAKLKTGLGILHTTTHH